MKYTKPSPSYPACAETVQSCKHVCIWGTSEWKYPLTKKDKIVASDNVFKEFVECCVDNISIAFCFNSLDFTILESQS